jgi:hypothetical protein
VGPDAVSPKYGTPKCEFICQAVECREAENEPDGCLVGAHPRFGELIAARLLLPGTGFLPLSPKRIASVKQARAPVLCIITWLQIEVSQHVPVSIIEDVNL